MGTEGPERQPDVDEEFARIVAGWSQVASTSGSSTLPPARGATGAPVRPASGPAEPPDQAEPLDPKDRPEPPAAQACGADPQRPEEGAADAAAASPGFDAAAEAGAPDAHAGAGPPDPGPVEASPPWRGYLPEEPDEHFQPPEPQLPPAHDATYWLAVIGLVGGPLLVLWAILFSRNADPGWSVVAGILLTVAGFGLLVLRGSGDRDPDDDGSRV